VIFADGRIKGYPRDMGPRGKPAQQFVRYVRGNPAYGRNDFQDNGDGTITDRATGLTWQKTDSGKTFNWEQSLNYAENLELAGHDDWRLPNAKELQSIVEYNRAPDAADETSRGPALAPIFQTSDPESYFWTGTTHLEGRPGTAGGQAVYICFGKGMGHMGPPGAGEKIRMNVHGAGAQRSDPKSGDPTQFPQGRGPQGDDVRIYNYVRCVRGGEAAKQDTAVSASPSNITGTMNQAAGRPLASPVIASLDLNSDGAIDADEIAKASESLKKLDKNGDGTLAPDEYRPQRTGGPGGPGGRPRGERQRPVRQRPPSEK
jgi:hypothetical protein